MNTDNAPLKVVCIKKDAWETHNPDGSFYISAEGTCPKYGEIVTAKEDWLEKDYFELAEYPVDDTGHPTIFLKQHFAPIQESYADATEKIAQQFTETTEYHDQKERIKPERVIQN